MEVAAKEVAALDTRDEGYRVHDGSIDDELTKLNVYAAS